MRHRKRSHLYTMVDVINKLGKRHNKLVIYIPEAGMKSTHFNNLLKISACILIQNQST